MGVVEIGGNESRALDEGFPGFRDRGRKVKIWVRISSGKYPNELTSCCLTLPPISKRERTNEGKRGEACARVRGGEEIIWALKSCVFFFFWKKI